MAVQSPRGAGGTPLKRVLFVSQFDPADQSAWSGTAHQMWKALQTLAHVDVLVVRPPFVVKLLDRMIARVGKRPEYSRARWVLRQYARRIERRGPYDLVFSPSSLPVAVVKGDTACAFWTDATFPLLIDYYPADAPLTAGGIRRGVRSEVLALSRARAVYASRWAAESAQQLYPRARPLVHPFGPNLAPESIDRIRRARAGRASLRSHNPTPELTGLWIGVEWVRKGGDVAVESFQELRRRGYDARLILVGVPSEEVPAAVQELAYVECMGRLSKAKTRELAQLEGAFARADVLVLPSTAEAAGIVVSEAALVGLPCVVSDVGGLGQTVRDADVGAVVPLGVGTAVRFADSILQTVDRQLNVDELSNTFSYVGLFRALLL